MMDMTPKRKQFFLFLVLVAFVLPTEAFWIYRYTYPQPLCAKKKPTEWKRNLFRSVSCFDGKLGYLHPPNIILASKSSDSSRRDSNLPSERPSDDEIMEMMRAEHFACLPDGADPEEYPYQFNEELAKSIIEFMSKEAPNMDSDMEEKGPSFEDIIKQIEADHLASIPPDVDPYKLFVANFPFDYDEYDLARLIVKPLHLPADMVLKDVKIVRDRDTQKSKGYAFVEFQEPLYASAALEQFKLLDYQWIVPKRKLVVERCKKRRPRKKNRTKKQK